MFFIIPCMDEIITMDLRTVTFNVPPQEILTKDSVTVAVDAVVYFKIVNPMSTVLNVNNYNQSTQYLACTTLRNILGTKTLAELLSHREQIATEMKKSLDDATDPWGIQVSLSKKYFVSPDFKSLKMISIVATLGYFVYLLR